MTNSLLESQFFPTSPRMKTFSLIIFLALTVEFQSDACSRKRKSSDRIRQYTPPTPSAGHCSCVPLHTCPIINQVLRGPRPFSNFQLTALRRATCDPLGDPKNPNVKCCDEFVNEIEMLLNSVDRTTEYASTASTDDVVTKPFSGGDHDFENECGTCDPSLDPRIVGGTEARIGQFPWIARLGYLEGDSAMSAVNDAEFLCGGSLISHYHILTAAHCVDRAKNLSQLRWVRLGEHDERSNPDCSPEQGCADPVQDMRVEWVEKHPNYRPTSFRNDIAIIKLQQSVNFTTWVHPVCLPTSSAANKNLTGLRAVVAGWGSDQPGTTGSVSTLQFLWKTIVDSEQCSGQYRGITTLGKGQLCAGGQKGRDSCNGDSGGPLARPELGAHSGNGFYTLVGVVSFGTKLCGSGGLPGVYSDVAAYLDWIKAATRDGWRPRGDQERARRWL